MGALISTVVWVAVTLLGVFVLVNTVASVRIKHREGGRGDVVIWSDSQNVWAVNPQVSRS